MAKARKKAIHSTLYLAPSIPPPMPQVGDRVIPERVRVTKNPANRYRLGGQSDDTKSQAWQRGWAESQEALRFSEVSFS
jgi:hypothetical protein